MIDGPDYKYAESDWVVVGPVTRWKDDQKHSGREGEVVGAHTNATHRGTPDVSGIVYRVRFVGGETVPLFEEDLLPHADADAQRIKWYQAELERLTKAVEEAKALEVPSKLPVGSSIFFVKTMLITKVAEDKWHWFYVSPGEMQFHSISTDKSVVREIKETLAKDREYKVFPADQD